jgi:hypothetical protein
MRPLVAGIVSERPSQSTLAMFETSAHCCYVARVFRLPLVMTLACVLLLSACSSVPTDAEPAGALELFLEAMGEAEDDPAARARAFGLLSSETRRSFARRARLAGALSARRFEPWEMIVEGRYRLRFLPRESRGFEERIQGDRAIVIVHGARRSERAEVPMVREHGKWRVHLQVPEMATTRGAVSPRPDAGVGH